MFFEEFTKRLQAIEANPNYEDFEVLIEDVVLNEIEDLDDDLDLDLDQNGVLTAMFDQLAQASTNPDLHNPASDLAKRMTEIARILFLANDLNQGEENYQLANGDFLPKPPYLEFPELEDFTQQHLDSVNILKNHLALGSQGRKDLDSFAEDLEELIPLAVAETIAAAPVLAGDRARGGSPV